MKEVKTGQIWRDTYGNGRPLRRGSDVVIDNRRTVRIDGRDDDGKWRLVTLTDTSGRPFSGGRINKAQEKTILSKYVFVSDGEANQEIRWNDEEFAEFHAASRKSDSRDQVTRIKGRMELSELVRRHGKPKCDAMWAAILAAEKAGKGV